MLPRLLHSNAPLSSDGQRPLQLRVGKQDGTPDGRWAKRGGDGPRRFQLIGAETPKPVALLAAAVLSEARNDVAGAEQQYRELAALHPDDPALQIELADFYKRKNRNEPAVESYHRALALDPAIHASTSICVSSMPFSMTTRFRAARAKSVERLSGLGQSGGRSASAAVPWGRAPPATQTERREEEIEAARTRFTQLGYSYGLARIFQYLGLAAGRELNYPVAAQAFGEALSRSQQVGNRILEGVALMNLGVSHESMGHASQAMTYYERSRDVYRQLGDERTCRGAGGERGRDCRCARPGPR